MHSLQLTSILDLKKDAESPDTDYYLKLKALHSIEVKPSKNRDIDAWTGAIFKTPESFSTCNLHEMDYKNAYTATSDILEKMINDQTSVPRVYMYKRKIIVTYRNKGIWIGGITTQDDNLDIKRDGSAVYIGNLNNVKWYSNYQYGSRAEAIYKLREIVDVKIMIDKHAKRASVKWDKDLKNYGENPRKTGRLTGYDNGW